MSEPSAPRCPWCSAVLEDDTAATCPSCGAQLVEAAGVSVPGVTAIDPEAVLRVRAELRAPGGITSMLTGGDETSAPSEAELPALARPDVDVRREMLRMELDARLAALTAQAHGLAAELGLPLEHFEVSGESAGAEAPDTAQPPEPVDSPAAGASAEATDTAPAPEAGPAAEGDAGPGGAPAESPAP